MIASRSLLLLGPFSLLLVSRAANAQSADQGHESTPPQPRADTAADVDIKLAPFSPPQRRYVVIELTPLNLEIRRYGGQVEIMPAEHHAVQLSAYYFNWTTGADSFNNTFRGIGGEMGYRYYFGDAGPRGFFLGPSFLLGAFDGVPQNGAVVHFENLGGAFDVGYQALLFDRLSLGAGLGLQYTAPTVDIPHQEVPASTVANAGLRPRFLLAFGVAL